MKQPRIVHSDAQGHVWAQVLPESECLIGCELKVQDILHLRYVPADPYEHESEIFMPVGSINKIKDLIEEVLP